MKKMLLPLIFALMFTACLPLVVTTPSPYRGISGLDSVQVFNLADTSMFPDSQLVETSQQLFAPESIYTLRLTLPESLWNWRSTHEQDTSYVKSLFSLGKKSINDAGLRYYSHYDDLNNCFINGVRSASCNRLSMDIRFNAYDSAARFAGVKQIYLHAMNNDITRMRALIASEMFRGLGIPVPRMAPVKLVINGKNQGLFILSEAADEDFKNYHFAGKNGALYRDIWPGLYGSEIYDSALTAGKEQADLSEFVRFGTSSLASGFVAANFVDGDQFTKTLVAMEALNLWDGPLTWFCGGSACFNRNYYWFQNTSEKKFTLIPYHMEYSLNKNAPWADLPVWDDTTYDCTKRVKMNTYTYAMPASCDPVVKSILKNQSQAIATARQYIWDNYLNNGWIESRADYWQRRFMPYIRNDSLFTERKEWRAHVELMKSEVRSLREQFAQNRLGKITKAFNFSPEIPETFENAAVESVRKGLVYGYTPRSMAEGDIDSLSALNGKKSLKLGFKIRDALDTSNNYWAMAGLRFSGSKNLNDYPGIRLRISADKAAKIRLQAVSDSVPGMSRSWGFDLNVSQTPVSLDLKWNTSVMPPWSKETARPLELYLSSVKGLLLIYMPTGLKRGATDSLNIKLDDIEFVK